MKRRHFLLAGAAATALPLAPSALARSGDTPRRFALAHRAPGAACFTDAKLRDVACAPRVRIALRAIQASSWPTHPLTHFDVDVMYRVSGSGAPQAGYRWAWQSRVGATGLRESAKPSVHELDANRLAALRVTYR